MTKRNGIRFRQLVEHEADCDAVRMTTLDVWYRWNSPWWMPSKRSVTADALGRSGLKRHGWRRWLILECNSTSCPARAIVLEDDILDRVPVGKMARRSATPQPERGSE